MNIDRKSTIHIVDDHKQNIMILKDILHSDGHRVLASNNAHDALEMALKVKPDLFLLDVMMPDVDGFDLAIMFKSDPQLTDIPIIFISAISDAEAKMKSFDLGGVDYITKPFQREEVSLRVEFHLRLRKLEMERITYIDKLQQREKELEELNKEKDNILRVVSHDMRNPLNGIMGISGLLKEDFNEDSETYELLHLVEKSGEGLLSLVNDLIDVAGIEAGNVDARFQSVDVCSLVMKCIELNRPASFAKKVELLFDCPGKPLNAEIDKSKLKQIVNNLISNAIKFTPREGTVKLKICKKGDTFELIVSDTGIGIPKESQKNLFARKTHKQRSGTDGEKGTGLGMTIIKSLIELHEGSIDVSSEEGKGTTFSVTIPLKNDQKEKVDW
jgi:signal transduction histidine kinase